MKGRDKRFFFKKKRTVENTLALRQVSRPPRPHCTGCPWTYSGNNGMECGVLDDAGFGLSGTSGAPHPGAAMSPPFCDSDLYLLGFWG